jgi:hypothetical protein
MADKGTLLHIHGAVAVISVKMTKKGACCGFVVSEVMMCVELLKAHVMSDDANSRITSS